MKISKPFGNYILIKPVQRKQVLVSDSGMFCEYGEVLAIGEDCKKVNIGDILGFLVWGVQKLEVEGETHYFIPEDGNFILGWLI